MASRKDTIRSLLFEELEPRLLFSADVAEPLAAEAVQEQLVEEPVIIVAEITEQQDLPAADNDSGAADDILCHSCCRPLTCRYLRNR